MARHPYGEKKTPLTGIKAFISIHMGWLIIGSIIGIVLFFLVADNDFEEKLDAPVEQTETIYGDEHPEREPTSTQPEDREEPNL